MATGPVSLFIQLYILQLHGTVIDVGIVITLFNAVSIPAAMIWGFTTDRFHRRVPIIIACYMSVAGILFTFLFVKSLYGVGLLYSIFSFVSSASATPLNLLIMESYSKSKWPRAFAMFSMVSSIGTTAGIALGFLWSNFLPLDVIVVPLGALSLASAVLSTVLIKEPSFVFERQMMILNRRSFFERILAVPMMFLKIPRLVDFRSVFRDMRFDLTRQVPILYLSIFAFYIASGIFNTSFAPSLVKLGVSNSQVFLVSFVAMIVQTTSFYYAGPYIERTSLKRTAIGGLIVRAICYGAIGVSSTLFLGAEYLGSSLILYPIAAGIAFAAYYTSSNTMIFNTLGQRGQASTLGVYSALVGIATMLGSLVSGFTSFYAGYHITFIIAGLCLGCAAALTSLITTQNQS
jgi:MFS family permease